MSQASPAAKYFFLGLVIGTISLIVAGTFFVFGRTAWRASGLAETIAALNQGAQATNLPDMQTPAAAPIAPIVTTADQWRGPADAVVTIIEYADFQCPYCREFHATMQQLLAAYPLQVRWIYKHFPDTDLHPLAESAAEAAECAGEQGKFWEFADQLFTRQDDITESLFPIIAGSLSLNLQKFSACFASGRYRQKVQTDYQSGLAAGAWGTPSNFINGYLVRGAVPFNQLAYAVELFIKEKR